MMSAELHARARQLIAQERVEGISQSEREWLSAHLRDCAPCTELARQTEHALRSMRTAAISLPEGLTGRTQFRVRLRAQELREREPRHRLMWITCGVSWALGVTTAPYVWRIFEWVGQHTGAPKIVLQLSFGLWWAIPALVAGAVMLIENARQANATGWLEQDR
jgi:hypothetical protein